MYCGSERMKKKPFASCHALQSSFQFHRGLLRISSLFHSTMLTRAFFPFLFSEHVFISKSPLLVNGNVVYVQSPLIDCFTEDSFSDFHPEAKFNIKALKTMRKKLVCRIKAFSFLRPKKHPAVKIDSLRACFFPGTCSRWQWQTQIQPTELKELLSTDLGSRKIGNSTAKQAFKKRLRTKAVAAACQLSKQILSADQL